MIVRPHPHRRYLCVVSSFRALQATVGMLATEAKTFQLVKKSNSPVNALTEQFLSLWQHCCASGAAPASPFSPSCLMVLLWDQSALGVLSLSHCQYRASIQYFFYEPLLFQFRAFFYFFFLAAILFSLPFNTTLYFQLAPCASCVRQRCAVVYSRQVLKKIKTPLFGQWCMRPRDT